MAFFVDKQNRRKSPVALAAFGAALVDMAVFSLLYVALAEPLYRLFAFESDSATNLAHSLIIAAVGTAVCCLWFLLRDKRVAPYGFACLALFLSMFLLAAALLDAEARGVMLYVIAMYGLMPVLVGNAVSWAVYLRLKRKNPAMNRRKTLREELLEGVEKETKRRPATAPPPVPEPVPDPTPEEDEESAAPPRWDSAGEEALLFYEDDDEESDD